MHYFSVAWLQKVRAGGGWWLGGGGSGTWERLLGLSWVQAHRPLVWFGIDVESCRLRARGRKRQVEHAHSHQCIWVGKYGRTAPGCWRQQPPPIPVHAGARPLSPGDRVPHRQEADPLQGRASEGALSTCCRPNLFA